MSNELIDSKKNASAAKSNVMHDDADRTLPSSYRWWIILAANVMLMLRTGPYFHGAGTFVAALSEEFNWSRSLLSGVFSFSRVEESLMAPISGIIVDRVGARRMAFAGMVIIAAGFAMLSQVQTPVLYYAAFITMSIGASLAGFIPALVTVTAWFKERRATAIALTMTGTNAGGVLVAVLASGISLHGWRNVSLGVSAVLLIAALPISIILGRKPPFDSNPTAAPNGKKDGADGELEFTGKEALRTQAFWTLAISHTIVNMSVMGVVVHGVPWLTDSGLTLQFAGTIVTAYTLFAMIFRIGGGIIGDRIHKLHALSIFIFLEGLGVFFLAFVSTPTTAFIFAIIYGLGYGGRGPLLHTVRANYFGNRALGTITGLSSIPLNIGMLLSPLLLGLLYDIQHTYRTGFAALGIATIIASFFVLLARNPGSPAHKQRQSSKK